MKNFKVTANETNLTYTIESNGSIYRTPELSKQEFEEMEYWTENDWKKSNMELIIVK
jgi:hypothetical protein